MKSLAWAMLSLGLLLARPAALTGQQSQSGTGVTLGRNYPNPFNPETWIPFQISEDHFANGQRPKVTLKIYNVLAQLVAIPVLQGSGQVVQNLSLEWNGTGNYVAYWDGKYLGTDRDAASGVYVYQLEVNGERQTQKMTIVK